MSALEGIGVGSVEVGQAMQTRDGAGWGNSYMPSLDDHATATARKAALRHACDDQ